MTGFHGYPIKAMPCRAKFAVKHLVLFAKLFPKPQSLIKMSGSAKFVVCPSDMNRCNNGANNDIIRDKELD